MTGALDMEAVAALCGYSWERFRKVWRQLPGFPAPIKRPSLTGKGTYGWRAESVQDYVEGRERALGQVAPQPQPANDPTPRHAHNSAVARQRAEIARRMAGGR